MSCLPRVASSLFILFSLRALQSYYYPVIGFRLTRTHIKFPDFNRGSSTRNFYNIKLSRIAKAGQQFLPQEMLLFFQYFTA